MNEVGGTDIGQLVVIASAERRNRNSGRDGRGSVVMERGSDQCRKDAEDQSSPVIYPFVHFSLLHPTCPPIHTHKRTHISMDCGKSRKLKHA
jgi:hypothetical protein